MKRFLLALTASMASLAGTAYAAPTGTLTITVVSTPADQFSGATVSATVSVSTDCDPVVANCPLVCVRRGLQGGAALSAVRHDVGGATPGAGSGQQSRLGWPVGDFRRAEQHVRR
jgi:hypothetical protein